MEDNSADANDQKFKVRDRRRFDSAGNERGESEGEKVTGQNERKSRPETTGPLTAGTKAAGNTAAGKETANQARPSAEVSTGQVDGKPANKEPSRAAEANHSAGNEGAYDFSDPGLTFSSFLISLATQALMQLGEIKAPDGVELPVDREAAKQTIDIISMLQEKTKGNLNADELRLIEEILHNLRISFVRVRQVRV